MPSLSLWKTSLKTWVLGKLLCRTNGYLFTRCINHHHAYSLVQDVANKTNEIAGDGTTTATVLARAIFTEGVKNVAAGCNPMDLRRGAQAAVDAVVDFLKENSRVITTSSEIAQVCVIIKQKEDIVGKVVYSNIMRYRLLLSLLMVTSMLVA